MEGIVIRDGAVKSAVSLPLGAVRLTERYVAEPEGRFTRSDRQRVDETVAATFAKAGFAFPVSGPVVGTGGALMVTRAILAARTSSAAKEHSPLIRIDELHSLFDEIAGLPLSNRADRIPGLPPERADIMPTALAIYLKVAALAEADHLIQSRYTLRYGFIE